MIIAEIGKNHHGSEDYAKEYIKKSFSANVDAVLFHIREKEFYKKTGQKRKMLSDSFYKEAATISKKKGKKFGITIADIEKVDFLEKIGIDFYKILSQDINNIDLIKRVLKTGKLTFISTGLSNYNEISKVMKSIKPMSKNIKLIHTTISSDIKHVNLNAINELSKKFNLPIAFGNHCKNPLVIYVSIAYNPSDIFFYVKGSKFRQHQDDVHAIKLSDLNEYVKNIKEIQISLGTKNKMKLSLTSKQLKN